MSFSILTAGLCICLCSSMTFLSAWNCSFSRSPAYQAVLPVSAYEPHLRVWQTSSIYRKILVQCIDVDPSCWDPTLSQLQWVWVVQNCELQFLCRRSEYSKSQVALSNFFLILLMPTAVGWLPSPWQPSLKMQGWFHGFMILKASQPILIENPLSCFLASAVLLCDPPNGSKGNWTLVLCMRSIHAWSCAVSRCYTHYYMRVYIISSCMLSDVHQREI